MKEKLLIVGSGGHGRSVAEAVMLSDAYEVVGFADDTAQLAQTVWGIPILGGTADLRMHRSRASAAIVAIGNNIVRQRLSEALIQAGFELAIVAHPRAVISPRAVIGRGSAIMAGAIVGTEAQLGMGVIVNCGAVVDHHAQALDFAHLGVNACMAGGTVLGRGAWMQAAASLGYGVKVEDGTVLPPGTALA